MRVLALLLWLALTGCAAPVLQTSDATLPEDARRHPENYVVVTVRNAPAAVTPYAASTARGYAGLGAYRASSLALEAADRIASAHRLHQVAAWPIQLLGVHCLVYTLPPAAQREQVMAALAGDPDVESVQPLSPFQTRAAGYDDPYASLQTNLVQMGVPAAQQWSRGAGVRVAIVDTGIDTKHPDFGGRLGAVNDFVNDGQALAEAHGTAVAGIIAALPNNTIGIAGIAPQATVTSYRGCWTQGGAVGVCNSFTLAQALAAAIDGGASIVNLSIGGPADPLLQRIVEQGLARGIVFFGAVPLSGRREGFPTAIDGVIAVDVAGRTANPQRVLHAPGVDIFTLTPNGHYDAVSGSSVATAEVTAVAALLLAVHPGLQAGELEALLDRSTTNAGVAGAQASSVSACVALRRLRPDMACFDSGAAVAETR